MSVSQVSYYTKNVNISIFFFKSQHHCFVWWHYLNYQNCFTILIHLTWSHTIFYFISFGFNVGTIKSEGQYHQYYKIQLENESSMESQQKWIIIMNTIYLYKNTNFIILSESKEDQWIWQITTMYSRRLYNIEDIEEMFRKIVFSLKWSDRK